MEDDRWLNTDLGLCARARVGGRRGVVFIHDSATWLGSAARAASTLPFLFPAYSTSCSSVLLYALFHSPPVLLRAFPQTARLPYSIVTWQHMTRRALDFTRTRALLSTPVYLPTNCAPPHGFVLSARNMARAPLPPFFFYLAWRAYLHLCACPITTSAPDLLLACTTAFCRRICMVALLVQFWDNQLA